MSVKKSREQYSREDAKAFKEEYKNQESDDIHVFLNKEQKERILAIADSLGPTEAAKLTGVAEQNIFRWRKDGCQRKKGSGRRPIYPDFEKELVQYIKNKREQGVGISTKKFIWYARSEAKKKKLDRIKFSRGWYYKFRNRNNISIRRANTGHTKPLEDIEKHVKAFREKIYHMINSPESIYDFDHIVNVDETGIPRDAAPKVTLEIKGTKNVVVNSSGRHKEKYTTVLTVTYTGKKLFTVIILKGKGVKKLKSALPHDFYTEYSNESWINTNIFQRWVTEVLARHAKKLPVGKKGLLIMDNHRSHINPKVLKAIKNLNYDIELLPPNCTGRLQPLDIGINKNLKEIYSQKWENWFEDVAALSSGKKSFPPPTKELCVSWIWKSYREVTEKILQNAWNIYRNIDEIIPTGIFKLIYQR